MSREVFLVESSDDIVYCTLSPSKAYQKAKKEKASISLVRLDSLPCCRVCYTDLEVFYRSHC